MTTPRRKQLSGKRTGATKRAHHLSSAGKKPLFTYGYPKQGSGDLQRFFGVSEEFRELSVGAREYTKADLVPWYGGSFYPHQIVSARLIEMNPRLFVMDRTGTGKFYVALAMTEMFRRAKRSPVMSYMDRNFFSVSKVYYVVTSSFLQGEVKENIKRLTGQKVNTEGKNVAKNYYNVLMLDSFESIAVPGAEYMRNSLVIVDEAHNIRNSDLRGTLTDLTRDRTLSLRLVLMSATPAYSGPQDSASLMNILLEPGKEIETESVRKEPGVLVSQLADYVTYMRESRTSIHRLPVTNYEIPNTGLSVFASFMRHEKGMGQAYQYYRALRDAELGIDPDKRSLYTKDTQISGFSYPDGTYGEEGMAGHVAIDSKGQFRIKGNEKGILLKKFLSTFDGMSILSARNENVVRMTDENPGSAFIILESIHQCIMLSLCFEESLDYRRLQGTMVDLIASDGSLRVENIPKGGKNYAFMRSGMPKTVRDALFAVFNHPENAEGEYIRIMIMTPVSGEGINYFNVTLVHVTARWVPRQIYQIESRGYRGGVHEALRSLRARRGDMTPVAVKIVYHASILRLDEKDELLFSRKYTRESGRKGKAKRSILDERLLIRDTETSKPVRDYSIDGHKYKTALVKQGPSDWAENEMRASAISYHLFRKRNTATNDPALGFVSKLKSGGTTVPSNALSVHAFGLSKSIVDILKEFNGSVTLVELSERLFKYNTEVPAEEQMRRTQHALFLLYQRSEEIVDRYGVTRLVRQEGSRIVLVQPHEAHDMATGGVLYYEDPAMAPEDVSLQEMAEGMNMLPELSVSSLKEFDELDSPAERIENIEAAYVLAREDIELPESISLLVDELNELSRASIRESVRYEDERVLSSFVSGEIRQEKQIKGAFGKDPIETQEGARVHYHNGETSIETYKANVDSFSGFVGAKLKSLRGERTRIRMYDQDRNRWRDASAAEHIIYVFLETRRYNEEKRQEKFKDRVYMLRNFVEPPKKSTKFVVDEDPRGPAVFADRRKKRTGLSWASWTAINERELIYRVIQQGSTTTEPKETDSSRLEIAKGEEKVAERIAARFPESLEGELREIAQMAGIVRKHARKRSEVEKELAKVFQSRKTFLLLHARRRVIGDLIEASSATEDDYKVIMSELREWVLSEYPDSVRARLEREYLHIFEWLSDFDKASMRSLLVDHLAGESAKEKLVIDL